ncbi:MAG: family 43 glycosylhydrolase [Clostridia bacterium]|nr:family 43 glycosylhydrolase [Clostridia bacterium]
MYNSIRPGKEWLDTNGKHIQAHGFSVFYDEKNEQYVWYGENKEKTDGKGTIWHWGVRYYTSKDLYNWEDRGLLIPPTPDDLTSPLHPTYCMDRPHILYCKKTGKYVAWLKIMLSGHNQSMCILTADEFGGPYTVDKLLYKPLKMSCGDFCLHADPDGKAYIWFERPHFEMICATLTDDYTAVTNEYSVHYPNLRPPFTREAPTYFEKDGKRYLITSGTGGYYPNPSQVCVFENPHGEYRDLGDPCIDDKDGTSFDAQFTSVLRLPETDQYIACADRWMPRACDRRKTKAFIAHMDEVFADYKPNREPREVTPMSGKEEKHEENTSISQYVWLPIEWEGEKPVIRWKSEWKI